MGGGDGGITTIPSVRTPAECLVFFFLKTLSIVLFEVTTIDSSKFSGVNYLFLVSIGRSSCFLSSYFVDQNLFSSFCCMCSFKRSVRYFLSSRIVNL